MPTPAYRVTYEWAQDGPGWSESFHTQSTSIPLIEALITAYTQARTAFMVQRCSLLAVRISDDNTFRDIPVRVANANNRGQINAPAATQMDSAVFSLSAGPSIRRYLYCRGLPRTYNDGRAFNTSSAAWDPLRAFATFLKNNGIGIFAQPDPSTAQIAVSYNTGSGLIGVTNPITGLIPGSYLTVTANRGINVPRGKMRVLTAPDSTHFTLRGWPLTADPIGVANFRPSSKSVQAVTDAFLNDVGERKVGRPFGLPRGRAVRRRT